MSEDKRNEIIIQAVSALVMKQAARVNKLASSHYFDEYSVRAATEKVLASVEVLNGAIG